MKSKKFTLGLLIFYLAVLTWIILFKLACSFEELPHMRNVNLIPFGRSVVINGTIDFREIVENILVFVPFGLFIRILCEKKALFRQIMPIICTSILFEGLQFLFAIGASDITDVITNSTGGILGIFLAAALARKSEHHWIRWINMISLVGALSGTGLLALLLLTNL